MTNTFIVTEMPWMADAECKGATGLFFPEAKGNAGTAKAVCATCPALWPCREWGISGGPEGTGEAHGVWGGLSVRERRAIRKRRAQAAVAFAALRGAA